MKDLEREALSPLSLSGLPKITSHFSTGSVFRRTLRGKPSHRCPLSRLAENRSPSFNRLGFVKDLEREALSLFPLFRLAENRSPFFCRFDFAKDLGREALSAHPAFRLAKNHSATFCRFDFVKDLEREALSPLSLSGLPKIVPHLSIDSIL